MDTDSPLTRWLLFDGDRETLALLFLTGVFAFLVALGQVGVLELADADAVDTIAGGLVPGLFTFLSIVLAINQLVLSQSTGTVDQVRERVADVREFREEVERRSHEAPSPLAPTGFLSVLVETIVQKANTLETTASEHDAPADGAVVEYATAVRAAAEHADRRVSGADPGRVNAVISLLDFDDSRQLYEARRLLSDHGDALSPEARETIHALQELLELFDVARTHFRTTYTQRTLARLSRLLLYTGLPAILATFVLGLSTFPGVDGWQRVVVVSLLLTAALSPLALLSSYILRVAAVSERTIGVGPFVSRPGSDGEFFVGGSAEEPRSDSPTEAESRSDVPVSESDETERDRSASSNPTDDP
ncbi:hypothetical protein [Halosimplex salinum]|uniref:hypothetical protein n=1 Tax=Halosimplex salinum TaxID=1710538 RepID=UPI000F46B7F2|nr:hypothetical protein [Halosimplex salinum]